MAVQRKPAATSSRKAGGRPGPMPPKGMGAPDQGDGGSKWKWEKNQASAWMRGRGLRTCVIAGGARGTITQKSKTDWHAEAEGQAAHEGWEAEDAAFSEEAHEGIEGEKG